MKTYRILAKITIGAYAHVVADSLEQAQDMTDELKYDDYTFLHALDIAPFSIEVEETYDADA